MLFCHFIVTFANPNRITVDWIALFVVVTSIPYRYPQFLFTSSYKYTFEMFVYSNYYLNRAAVTTGHLELNRRFISSRSLHLLKKKTPINNAYNQIQAARQQRTAPRPRHSSIYILLTTFSCDSRQRVQFVLFTLNWRHSSGSAVSKSCY